MADVSKLLAGYAAGIREHLRVYLETDGKEAYYRDMSHVGGDPKTITLILKTVGRKSGKTRLAPLLFNYWRDEIVIVGSKGGSDEHPAWFHNLKAAETVDVQVRDKRYRCKWRIAEGAERAKIWPFMVDYYPEYRSYQARTEREIPVVVLTPVEELKEKFVLESSEEG
jgi:deazaflavin-dependent oxidoreductase (nitroreductase family)